jgi:L-aspartate oxidase
MNDLRTEVLVLGSGLAGGIAALQAAELGHDVVLVGGFEAASRWAQGGIVYKGENDPESLIQDILNAGCHRNYLPVVELIAREGWHHVDRWLRERMGVRFDVSDDGALDLNLEAAHQSRRILHVKDSTGAAIMERLNLALHQEKRIRVIDGTLVELLVSNRHDERAQHRFLPTRVQGAYVYLRAEKQIIPIAAQAVVLATGGFSQLYQHSTGPSSSRGDGIAAAQRVGARTLHLEYVQFHPTALFIDGEPRRLLTEALRGAGAELVGSDQKPFVDKLAARDVVARAIHEELVRSGASCVWLDLKPIANFDAKFPNMANLLRSKGFDPHRDLIPVVPAAHYTIGGVWTDIFGATSVPGLFAAGEVACTGLHGANRLASTSLLEAVVFGERAARAASEQVRGQSFMDFRPRPWVNETAPVDPALLQQDWQFLRQTLWNYLGLVRSERRLRRAEKILVELRTEVESFYQRSALSEELISLRNAVLVATLVLYAALRNPESVGTHFLRDNY